MRATHRVQAPAAHPRELGTGTAYTAVQPGVHSADPRLAGAAAAPQARPASVKLLHTIPASAGPGPGQHVAPASTTCRPAGTALCVAWFPQQAHETG